MALTDVYGRGAYDEATGLFEWYEDAPKTVAGTFTVKLVLDSAEFEAALDAAVERARAKLALALGAGSV